MTYYTLYILFTRKERFCWSI